MSVWDVLAALRRRWLVALVALIVALVSVALVSQPRAIYWAGVRAELVPVVSHTNRIATSNDVAIPLAGVLEQKLNSGRTLVPATAPDITIVDQGIYDGWVVRVPDTGGQWAHNFAEPTLVIQASGDTVEAVDVRMAGLIKRLKDALEGLQDSAGVSPANRIEIDPATLEYSVRMAQGHGPRAAAVTAGLGIALTIAAALIVDQVQRRREDAKMRMAGLAR